MKKLGKIKLDQLNKAELSEKELNRLLGGENCCLCACAGPSGPVDNFNANVAGSLYSPSWTGGTHGSHSNVGIVVNNTSLMFFILSLFIGE